eukprot:scaffold7970_cov118-Cylindrotheca_fusiformis.AAC.5
MSSVSMRLEALLSESRPKKRPETPSKSESIYVGNGSTTSVTANLQAAMNESRIQRLIIRRRKINALVSGAIQDLLASRTTWKLIELTTTSRAVQRILNALRYVREVNRLVIIQPTDGIISLLGTTLLRKTEEFARVEALSLIDGSLSLDQAYPLKEGLSQCSLKSLRLTKCSFDNAEAMKEVSFGLRNCRTLEHLSLCQCHLEDDEIAVIIGQLIDHPSLESLDLSVNYCQLEGTKSLAALLVSSAPIKHLDISCQDVWDGRDYFVHLANALKNPNCELSIFDSHSNFLTDVQMKWLIEGIEQNRCLKELLLCDNSITDDGMNLLSKAIPVLSPSLKTVDISNNSYTHAGIKALEEGMARNTSIMNLKLDDSTLLLEYYLALNNGGRCLKLTNSVGLSVWPLILERTDRTCTLGSIYVEVLFNVDNAALKGKLLLSFGFAIRARLLSGLSAYPTLPPHMSDVFKKK